METAEDEEAAGIYSKKLIKDKEIASPAKGGTNIHSHLHSFEEEQSYYDSQDDDEEVGSNDYDQYEYERKQESSYKRAPPGRAGQKDRYSNQGGVKQKLTNKEIEDAHGIKMQAIKDEVTG